MSGWPAVTILIIVQIAVAALLVRAAARRWWDYLVIAVSTAALVRPAAHIIGGISEYLPYAIWSDDLEGKDQVILATVASTVLLPLMASALAVYVVNKVWRASRTPRGSKVRDHLSLLQHPPAGAGESKHFAGQFSACLGCRHPGVMSRVSDSGQRHGGKPTCRVDAACPALA